VRSNRADLISGGDALVEIAQDAISVRLNGTDVTPVFVKSKDGRRIGRITGLALGENHLVVARAGGGARQALTITNHPIGGPVFAGPQVQPWSCATEVNDLGAPLDEQCNTPAVYRWQYKSTVTGQFAGYDPDAPPPDVAMTTTDQGHTVPYVVRIERGVIDRGVYDIAVLFDPLQGWEPWAPQAGFNGKALVRFRGDCSPRYGQGDIDNLAGPDVMNDAALSRGFAVMASALNILGQNCNDVVSAEAMMMLKEHFIETYGEIRYAMGDGESGGSMQQNWIAANYPGLLDGIQPSATLADIWIAVYEAEDCHLLDRVFYSASPLLWALPAQQAWVAGHASITTCIPLFDNPVGVMAFSRTMFDPDYGGGCLGGVVGNPDSLLAPSPPWVYSAQTNPEGTRCTLQDYAVAVWGRRPPEAWGEVEQRIGRGFANRPFDNEGVQYGLTALESGLIAAEQFVDLNEKIGGLDIDWNWQPRRSVADPQALEIAHRAGKVLYPRESAKVPIMEIRGSSNFEIHTDYHSYVLRARLDQANGHHDNHVLWTGPVPLAGDPQGAAQGFLLLDEWLARIEADGSGAPLEEKVLRHKPAGAVDACWIAGEKVTDMSICRTVFPYFSGPRIVAGSPWVNNVLKCQLKPLDRADYSVAFDDGQWSRLQQAFPTGVCDWTRPGVSQQPSVPWLSFAGGAGGAPLGRAPTARALSP